MLVELSPAGLGAYMSYLKEGKDAFLCPVTKKPYRYWAVHAGTAASLEVAMITEDPDAPDTPLRSALTSGLIK